MFPIYYTPKTFTDVYFSADFHGFHKNISRGISQWSDKSRCRDFDDEVQMTNHLVNTVNAIVPTNATLIFVGDWSFNGQDKITQLRDMINCRNIIMIVGNHDKHIINSSVLQKLFTAVLQYNEFRYHKKLFCQFHYPITSWNEIGKGSYMIHGHCHGSLQGQRGRVLDIGVDVWDYKPLHIDQVCQILDNQSVVLTDHHSEVTNYA